MYNYHTSRTCFIILIAKYFRYRTFLDTCIIIAINTVSIVDIGFRFAPFLWWSGKSLTIAGSLGHWSQKPAVFLFKKKTSTALGVLFYGWPGPCEFRSPSIKRRFIQLSPIPIYFSLVNLLIRSAIVFSTSLEYCVNSLVTKII